MIENKKLIDASFDDLWARFPSQDETKKLLLREINLIGAGRDILLNMQSKNVITILLKQLDMHDPIFCQSTSLADFALGIYDELEIQMNKETAEQLKTHQAQGHFSRSEIHDRPLADQLQDNDMTRFMPFSHGNIDVLGVINRLDRSNDEIMIKSLKTSLTDTRFKHIIAPIGPGHWRGMYLTKPAKVGGKFTLELFDPYGPTGANAIEDFVLTLLLKAGLSTELVDIKYSGPIIAQQDGYACGDFTCAYSHKKMKEFGASAGTGYNQFLIDVLDAKGNIDNALREAVNQVSSGKVVPAGSSSSLNLGSASITPADDDASKLILASSSTSEKKEEVAQSSPKSDEIKTIADKQEDKNTGSDVPVKKIEETKAATEEPSNKLKQLEPIFKQIEALESKALEFPAKRKAIKDALNKVSSDMRNICSMYQNNVINLKEFKDKAHLLLTDEKSPELEEIKSHRGCKRILANLLAFFVSGGLLHIGNCVWKRNLTLFNPDTKSSALVNKVDEAVNDLTDENTDEKKPSI